MDSSGIAWHLEAPALGADIEILRGLGREGMNELSRFELELLSPDPIDPAQAIGSGVTLAITDRLEELVRNVGLVVSRVGRHSVEVDGIRTSIELVPAHALLTLASTHRIFQDKTAPKIVEEVLAEANLAGDKLLARLSGSYESRLHCTQYAETTWAFIERLLAEEGISYWFDTVSDVPKLVLGDGKESHEAMLVGSGVYFEDPSGMVGPRTFYELELSWEMATEATMVRDYDVRQPDVYVEARAGAGAREVFEYPARVRTAGAASARAQARLEQLRRFAEHATGRSRCARLAAGRVAVIEGASDEAFDRAWIVARVEHHYSAPTKSGRDEAKGPAYDNRAVLVPHDGPPHRPAPPASRPRNSGVEVAIVTGAGGEEIHTNDLGELKIRFPWDRSGIGDDKSSTWVRCLQLAMDGSMLLPRVSWEVPVAFYDGDPDRPLVLGRTYNAEGLVPYGLPGKKATTTLQSATSPRDGTTNEIRMADDGGSQEMFVHATRDLTVAVGGTRTTLVGADELHDVTLSYDLTVTGPQTSSIGADQKVEVGTNYEAKIAGSRSETIGGLEHTKVTGNRVVGVEGGYVELVGAMYGLQANQGNVETKGAYTRLVGAVEAQAAGLGFSESVAGARIVSVGATRILTTSGDAGETVNGLKTITAGASSAKADGAIQTAVKGSATITAGSLKVQAAKPIVIDADTITVKAASLDAGAFKLGGGAMKIKKGTTKVDGTIKRKGLSKVGQ